MTFSLGISQRGLRGVSSRRRARAVALAEFAAGPVDAEANQVVGAQHHLAVASRTVRPCRAITTVRRDHNISNHCGRRHVRTTSSRRPCCRPRGGCTRTRDCCMPLSRVTSAPPCPRRPTEGVEEMALRHALPVVLVVKFAVVAALAQAAQPVDAHRRLARCPMSAPALKTTNVTPTACRYGQKVPRSHLPVALNLAQSSSPDSVR